MYFNYLKYAFINPDVLPGNVIKLRVQLYIILSDR